MKRDPNEIKLNEIALSLSEFMASFNQNMPESFLQVTEELLVKFREEHKGLFRKGGSWSLDQHRKKVMDWLPRNSTPAS